MLNTIVLIGRLTKQYVLADVIRDGLATIEDPVERIEATLDCIRTLHNGNLRLAASLVRDGLDRRECIDNGLCPDCGSRLTERTVREAHPYGSTVAVEEWRQMLCPVHGEVQA